MYFLTVDAVHVASPAAVSAKEPDAMFSSTEPGVGWWGDGGVEEGPTRGWWGEAEIGVHDWGLAFSSEVLLGSSAWASGGGMGSRNATRDAL